MKKFSRIFWIGLMITLMIPFSCTYAENYVYTVNMQEGDTSALKQFVITEKKEVTIIVSNYNKSTTCVEFKLHCLEGEVPRTICQDQVERGKPSGHRIKEINPGIYLLHITSPGKGKVQGRILVLDQQESMRIDKLREPEHTPSKGCCIQ